MKLLKSTASLGGEILGINLSQKLGKDQIQFLNQCWDDRLVLVFKKFLCFKISSSVILIIVLL